MFSRTGFEGALNGFIILLQSLVAVLRTVIKRLLTTMKNLFIYYQGGFKMTGGTTATRTSEGGYCEYE